ncbi:protoporphyrinogen oxidase [Phaeodactylum tricornutum CCAP 1055/1]|uniref:Protoporphyrinogen oxidase n=1 Tax=Phaeodactylum tricornutum (strain CCAP 1055/1) TaxID=556484 RepID=B7GDU9_PHATC|nr:protoporphyrinogen oxidase [Phaeodactylum tricornutum CCAP 1055/1]EEC43143.1 protoporphyrinogen oxidase [Phaeodactylum tricornutum CCAP 1055/1]|eukprot:XP_002185274.1 protoporphyrinogen oxidase [Phaeodactylum tricornutum CCAP 1055/1]
MIAQCFLVTLSLVQSAAAFVAPRAASPFTASSHFHSPIPQLYAAAREVDCLVVGSGVSGSSLAFNLVKNHDVDTLMVERNEVVGGNLISKENEEGFVWEEGPNSFQPTPYISRLVHELGITKDLVLADGSLPRFVYWQGEGAGAKLANLHALPTNLPGDLLDFNLLTWPGKIRAGLGAIGLIAPPPTDREESIREFVTRHLGAETFERVIDPFVSGVYAGDPDELAMKAALKKIHRLEGLGDLGPGLVSGAINRFKEIADEKTSNPPDPAWPTYKGGQLGSFRKGLQTLALAAEEYLGPERVMKNTPIDKVEKLPDGRFKVTVLKDDKPIEIIAKSVCLTSPTRVTCKVAADLVPAATRLAEVYSPPVASVTMAYKKEWFKELPGGTSREPLRGFGHLLPRKMGVRSLGTIWSSSLFPGRAPEGWELLLTYIGGARDKGIADLSEEEIYKQVDADNHEILLKSDAPSGKRIGIRVWQTAIPQYRKGHLEILDALEADEAKVPGFYLGGNYRTGFFFCCLW